MSAAALAVMLSGSGRTLENLLGCIEAGELPARVALVIASRECRGAEIARAAGLPTSIEPGEVAPDRLAHLLGEAGAAWVVLAGYLRRVRIPPAYQGRVVNIHPSLLPAFGGRGMHGMRVHEAALAAFHRGEVQRSGCTVHLCTDELDAGRIVVQAECPIRSDDTPETLAARVFELEKRAYPEALRRLLAELADRGNDRACEAR